MKTSMRFVAMGSVAAIALAAAGIGMGMGGRDAASTVSAPAADTKTYTIDGGHSSVMFKIKHANVSNFYGRFNKVSGSFTTGETLSVDVSVDPASVDTNSQGRDDHVKGPEYFAVKEFPSMSFKGANFKKSGESAWKGEGELLFRGQKKMIEVEIKLVGSGPAMRGSGEMAGIESVFTIKRSDFGDKGGKGGLGDEVTLFVGLEGGNKGEGSK